MLRAGFIILEGWENRFNVTPLLGGMWDDLHEMTAAMFEAGVRIPAPRIHPSLPRSWRPITATWRLPTVSAWIWPIVSSGPRQMNRGREQPGLFCLKHNRCQLRQLQKCLVKQVLFRVITWTQVLHVHIFPAFSWMRSTLKLFLLSRQIVPSSIFLVSNYEVQDLVSIHHFI